MPFVSKNVTATVSGSVGIVDAALDRLAINADGSINAVTTLGTYSVIDFMDTALLVASTTTIPKSSGVPVTVVASLAADCSKIQCLDTTGKFIGIYSDPAGTPVLEAIVGPGSDQTIEVTIPAATVIGLRNMEDDDIVIGNFALNFLG